jgi:uncharacterized membrane protein YedE/YeeE
MKLRVCALGLGVLTGFVFAWARMTDPKTFRRMLSLRSPRIYLLMCTAVSVAFVGARLLRGRRALLNGARIEWRSTRPTRAHVVGSVLFGVGWGISDACPGPIAAQLGSGRVLALAVAAGVLAGVKLQPALARAAVRALESRGRAPQVDLSVPTVPAAEVL